MHVPLFVLLAMLTFPYWFPVAVFGGAAIILCWVAVFIPFVCVRWIYRQYRPSQVKEAPHE